MDTLDRLDILCKPLQFFTEVIRKGVHCGLMNGPFDDDNGINLLENETYTLSLAATSWRTMAVAVDALAGSPGCGTGVESVSGGKT